MIKVDLKFEISKQWQQEVTEVTKPFLIKLGKEINARAQRIVNNEIGVISGNFRRHFRLVPNIDGNNLELSVSKDTPFYWEFLEFGTRPHSIRPKNASTLYFEIGGRGIFTRHVNHPGHRGYQFITRAFASVVEDINRNNISFLHKW